MNTPINFEIAKLLKEKGFNLPIRTAWYLEDVAYWNHAKNHNESNVKVSAPTIAEVMMWIYEKYGIWIYVRNFKTLNFCAYILKDGDPEYSITTGFNSPTEAYEAAIEYTLKNLI